MYRLWERIRVVQHLLSFMAITFQIFLNHADTLVLCSNHSTVTVSQMTHHVCVLFQVWPDLQDDVTAFIWR